MTQELPEQVYEAILKNNVLAIEKYLNSGGNLYSFAEDDEQQYSMLFFAINSNKVDVVKYLLNKRFDINKCCFIKKSRQWIPANYIAMNSKINFEIQEIFINLTDFSNTKLLDNKFNIIRPLLKLNDERLVKLILNKKEFNINSIIRLNFANNDVFNSIQIVEFANLFYAALFFGCKLDILILLLENGANVDPEDALKLTNISLESKNFLLHLVALKKNVKVNLAVLPNEILEIISTYAYSKIIN